MVESRRTKLALIINSLLGLKQVEGESVWDEYARHLSMTVEADAFAVLSLQPDEGMGRILGGAGLATARNKWAAPQDLPILAEYAVRSIEQASVFDETAFSDDPFLKRERVRLMLLKGTGDDRECFLTAVFRREDRPFNTSERERFAAVSGVISLLYGSRFNDGDRTPHGARDQLTGLGLFPQFHGALSEEISRARRSAGALTMGIMAVEPSRKASRKDALLDVSRKMLERLRDFDTLARYGPGELAFILPDLRSSMGVEVLSRILADVVSLLGGTGPAPVIYLGLASYPDDGATVERLIEMAEAAMNRAREASDPGVHKWKEERMENRG